MSKLIVGNWKLNPMTAKEAVELASKIDVVSPHAVVLCPPAPFLGVVKYPWLGAQDVSEQIKGAYTGQISASALQSLGVKYCIVGHSERRLLGETDQQIAQKIENLLYYKITPIVCVGYGTTVQQDELEVVDILNHQLGQVITDSNAKKIVVAYEPVWAIGSKRPATADHAEQIGLFIKTKYGVNRVLYGGSVNGSNFESFLKQPHIGGLLIGGASLLSSDFNKIIA